MHLVGILFPHINDDARSKPHQIYLFNVCNSPNWLILKKGRRNFILPLSSGAGFLPSYACPPSHEKWCLYYYIRLAITRIICKDSNTTYWKGTDTPEMSLLSCLSSTSVLCLILIYLTFRFRSFFFHFNYFLQFHV